MIDYATLARIEDHLRRIADALESKHGSPEAPPPDRSWVTTEDIGRPRPKRPSPMRPAQWRNVDDSFVVGVGAAALVFVAVVLLLFGTLP